MRRAVESRNLLSLVVSTALSLYLFRSWLFPVENDLLQMVPERGLFTGIAIAVGSGKTTGCMYPFAEQMFAYCANEAERRVSSLVLEVKGDFCHKVRGILEKHGCAEDYAEISLVSPYRYNPLHNELEAYALAIRHRFLAE